MEPGNGTGGFLNHPGGPWREARVERTLEEVQDRAKILPRRQVADMRIYSFFRTIFSLIAVALRNGRRAAELTSEGSTRTLDGPKGFA